METRRIRRLIARWPRAAGVAMTGLLLAASPAAHVWATAENVRSGNAIARPFEERLFANRPLPVLRAEDGPYAFGHWVSAPDFGRGIVHFVAKTPAVKAEGRACALTWNAEGVTVNGEPIDDGSSAESAEGFELDCLNGWRLNNSHFGDFARAHFRYYHEWAIEAARRYRASRQPACREAAYALEGWGQHYLTDMTASGHGWNPSGHYGDTSLDGLMTLEGPGTRMRIHNFLNKNGARMAAPLYDKGRFWGDESSGHTPNGLSIPEQPDGDAQKALTLRIAHMALGQVISAAECGASPDPAHLFVTADPAGDPRTVYVSNEAMCAAMYGRNVQYEIWADDVLNLKNLFSVDDPTLKSLVRDCRSHGGTLTLGSDGQDLAAGYFADARGEQLDRWRAIDPEAGVDLAQLGCGADLPVVPIVAGEADLCGQALCEVPARPDGSCRAGLLRSAGCCVPPATGEAAAATVTRTDFLSTLTGREIALKTPGAVPGDPAELLWLAPDGDGASFEAERPIDGAPERLAPGGVAIPDGACGRQGSVTAYEARITAPPGALAGRVVNLVVSGMDEGLRVQVDGHAVAHLTRPPAGSFQPLLVPLLQASASGAEHVVRLTHLNDCGEERPLEVALSLDRKADELEGAADGGCSTGGRAAPSPGGLLTLGALLLLTRRLRRQRA